MKLNVHWALPVNPVLKDQSQWKGVKTSYKKIQSPNTIQFLDYCIRNGQTKNLKKNTDVTRKMLCMFDVSFVVSMKQMNL